MTTTLTSVSTETRLTPGPERDTCPVTSSLIIGSGVVVLAMGFSLFLAGLLWQRHAWYVPSDIWLVVDGGRYVWNGALGYVYQGSGSYALPLSFIVMAPVSGLVDRFGLVEGAPYTLAHPSAWLVVGPYSMLFGVLLLHAVRRLAWDLGVRRRLWLLQVVVAVVALLPAAQWGHFEDVIALTFVIHATRRLLRADCSRAALYLSAAVAAKQWAMLLIPLLVWQAQPGRRARALLLCCALPAALLTYFLAVDWTDASRQLLSEPNMIHGSPGHLAFWATWLGSETSRASRALALLAAIVAASAIRRSDRLAELFAAIAAVLLIRPLSEAINYSYYWSPGLLVTGLVGVAVFGRFRWRDWALPVAAAAWGMPRTAGVLWWPVEMALLVGVAWQLATTVRAARWDAILPAASADGAARR